MEITRNAARPFVFLLLVACGKDPKPVVVDASVPVAATTASAQATPKVEPKPKPPWPSDAPDRSAACSSHEDCAVLMHDAILPPDPCCTQRGGFLPVSSKYAEWTSTYREAHCKGVACPSSPLPGAEPSCCASIGRCVKKKCIGGCEDPTLDAPKVVWHEAACRMAAH